MRKYVKWAITLGLIIMVFLWGRMIVRDTTLTPVAKEAKDWIINGVNAVRLIGEDEWVINANKVIRRKGKDEMNDIFARINGPSGERTINSPKGLYSDSAKTLVLFDAFGTWQREDGPLNWNTPEANWKQEGDEWSFPKGITANNPSYQATGASAVFKDQTKIHLNNGCIIWWQE